MMSAGRELHQKNKGGRPPKAVKRNQLLAIKCTLAERRVIQGRARKVELTVSEYLRQMGLTGKIDSYRRALPKEILLLAATLNHLAANLNQIARKRNRMEELNALERATLKTQSTELKELALQIKNFLV